MYQQLRINFFIFLGAVLVSGCSSKVLHVDNSEKMLKIDAYDKSLKVKEIAPPPQATVVTADTKKTSEIKKVKTEVVKKNKKPAKKLPTLEDAEGFDGRRPIQDPFRPGEKTTLKLSYFNIVAGSMVVEVLPFVEVNGKKSYHFQIQGTSNSLFSSFYAVDDSAETFMDYDQMVPYNMSIHVKETKQLREVRSYFDWKNMKAKFWEKKITKTSGVEEKNLEWKIEPFSQNVFSAAFYLRTFKLEPGKTIEFRVSDNEKNMVVKGHVLRREKIATAVGELDTIVVKPEIQIDGIFKPMGDVYFWLTDDDRKFIVRIESKIKIGTITAAVSEIHRE
jgi:hypothetical protein